MQPSRTLRARTALLVLALTVVLGGLGMVPAAALSAPGIFPSAPGIFPVVADSPTAEAITATAARAVIVRGNWAWPLDGRRVIARAFLAPPHAYGPGHRGVDLRADGNIHGTFAREPGESEAAAPIDAPAGSDGPAPINGAATIVVVAPADGVVAYAGRVADRPLLTIDHGNEHVSTLEPVDASVQPGQYVVRGEEVGHLAGGGHSAAGTLHLGVRIAGEYVNPLLFLGGVERARLLPLN